MINLQDPSERKLNEAKQEGRFQPPASEELLDQPEVNSATDDNTKALSPENGSNTPKNSKTEEEQSETSNSNEKTLKKPDKILPCPRCNSMDTKFCYYNNYNVNQPRHFCKNCQRYWTAGGTMRNVPVGAGRRKNKNSVNHFRQMAVSEAFQNVSNGIRHPSIKTTTNGTVLTFGGETPLCESMASVLNIAEKTNKQNGFCKPEELKIPVSYGGGDNNGNDRPNGFHQIPCFPGGPWPYPWASPQWNAPPPPPPPPGFCPQGFPMPFYPPPAFWAYPWNVPWVSQPVSSPNQKGPHSGPNSPTLGKHPRDGNEIKSSESNEDGVTKENNSERCIWVPKTLRIDDPGEAAKSSIWATLGIKIDKADKISGGGLFKAFNSKGGEKNYRDESSRVLQANPAALSRSLNFQESS